MGAIRRFWSLLFIAALSFSSALWAQTGPGLPIEHRAHGSSGAIPVGPNTPDLMAAHFINVGQGSGAVFEFSCGLVVIDTGGQEQSTTDWRRRFTDYLDRLFARRTDLNRTIDVLYITHPHPDHTLGISSLIAANGYRIRNVVTDAATTGRGIGQQQALIRYANQHQIPQVQIRTSMIGHSLQGLWSRNIDPLSCRGGDPDIRVLWGYYDEPHHWPAREEEDENNHSVAVRIAFGESSFLVTGDMEAVALQAMIARYAGNSRLLDTDVYVAGHHGSRNGTIEYIVRRVSPELAVISAGNPSAEEPGFVAYNYGHPNRVAIGLLSDPTFGVRFSRPTVHVAVGIRGRAPGRNSPPPEYGYLDLSRAIFSTGWDGDIVVIAGSDGAKRVIID